MARKTNVKNPKNPNSNLFRRLTRIFSGPIVDYRSQTIRKYRRTQLDKFAQTFRSLSGQHFRKASYNPFHNLQSNVISAQNRVERYADFDQMEYTPEIASALDIYADEMTTSSDLQPLLRIDCPNEEIKTVLHTLYHNIMNIEFNLFGWCRTMCKYGDYFLYIDLDEEHGIKNVIGLPYNEVERIEGEDKTNPNYVQFQWNSAGMTFENWQVAHFRILGNDRYSPYGTSVLDPARRIWRQLTLLEDAVMAYRIVRSPERRVFYIDTGNVPPQDVEQYIQKVMTQMKRNQIVDADSGRVDLRYNPLAVEEDYYIPIRGGTSSRIETLPGGSYTGDIDDIKYMRDKLFSALKIPQSYLSRGEGSEEDKTTLAQKDIRFARTIQRLQRVVISELEKLGIVHLYSLGYRGADLISFKLKLSNPSKIAELQELEYWKTKFDVASSATEGYFSRRWVAHNIFDMSEEEFVRNQRELYSDRKFLTALDAVSEEEAAPVGANFDEQAFNLEEPTPDLEEPEAEPETPAEEEGEAAALLAAPPAKRDDDIVYKRDGSYTKKGWKGKHYKKKGQRGKRAGARRRHYKSLAGPEIGTERTTFPGYSDLKSLSYGITEEKETNYKDEEMILMELNNDIKTLITELENKKDETQAQ